MTKMLGFYDSIGHFPFLEWEEFDTEKMEDFGDMYKYDLILLYEKGLNLINELNNLTNKYVQEQKEFFKKYHLLKENILNKYLIKE
jgi:hypothetical protein